MSLLKRFETSGLLRKQVIALCLLVVAILAVLEIWAVNRLATFGEEISKLEATQAVVELENLNLENHIANSLSLAQIAQEAARLGFVKPVKIDYLLALDLASR